MLQAGPGPGHPCPKPPGLRLWKGRPPQGHTGRPPPLASRRRGRQLPRPQVLLGPWEDPKRDQNPTEHLLCVGVRGHGSVGGI